MLIVDCHGPSRPCSVPTLDADNAHETIDHMKFGLDGWQDERSLTLVRNGTHEAVNYRQAGPANEDGVCQRRTCLVTHWIAGTTV